MGGDSSVRLSWSAPSSDGGSPVTGYRLYRGTTAGGESRTPIADHVTSRSFTDTSVANGTTYYYRVAAVNAQGTSPPSNEAHAAGSPTVTPAGTGVCAGLRGCRVVARADVNGDGRRDAVGLARRGGGLGATGAVILRVRTAPHHVVQVRRRLESWTGSPWAGVANLDGRRGKDLMVGRQMGAAARFYQSLTWRHGHLVLLDAPGPDRWWGTEQSATVRAGWLRRAADPAGSVRRRVATREGSSATSPYRGRVTTYKWTAGGWHRVHGRTVTSLTETRARHWGGFHVPGLARW